MNRYFIIDTGNKMIKPAMILEDWLKENNFHYLIYLTSEEYFLSMEEISEDEFLDIFSKQKHEHNG